MGTVIVVAAIAVALLYRAGLFSAGNRTELLIFIGRMRRSQHALALFFSIYSVGAALGVPVTALTLAGGVLFSTPTALLLNWAADMTAATISFGAGRIIVGVRKSHAVLPETRGFLGLLRLRVIPVVPFSVLNFGSAAYGMSWSSFLAATAIGVVPSVLVYTLFASSLTAGISGQDRNAFVILVISGVGIIALTFLPSLVTYLGKKRRLAAMGVICLALSAFPAGPLLAQATPDDIRDLPTREIPSISTTPRSAFVLFITGDGGWAELDKVLTTRLAEDGFFVVGVDSRAYLRHRRTPDQVAQDMGRILRHYSILWHRSDFVLAGYSRGADLAPFVVTRLAPAERKHLSMVAMFGLGPRAGFEFHFQDIFRDVKRAEDLPTVPELEKIRDAVMFCVYGAEEKQSGCRDAPDTVVRHVERPGGHHFDSNYKALADLIVQFLPENPHPR